MMATLDPNSMVRKVFPTARRLLVERSLKSLDTALYDHVLIIGAGHDPYREMFENVASYTTLDMFAFNQITDVVADACVLPFRDQSFDCVMAIEVMEHVKSPVDLVCEAHRVLNPGGALILSVPFAYHQHADPFDYWRPTRGALKMATRQFSTVRISEQGNRIHAISDLITTAHHPWPIFFPLRILNRLLTLWPYWINSRRPSTAPSGFFVIAEK